MNSSFSEAEKCEVFDKIYDLYFEKNFGSTSKSDFETLLFSEYIEHCIATGEKFDDYTLSKQLGITQSRIRTLKERKELKYPYNSFNWKESFAKEIVNSKYDEKDHCIKTIIQDVNVMNELHHYIEEYGWYYECSLNKKLLKIPLNCFMDIFIKNSDISQLFSKENRRKLEKLGKEDSFISEFIKDFTKDGFKNFIMSAPKGIIPVVLNLLTVDGPVKIALSSLAKIIGGM